MHDCRQYFAATRRRVTFEYTLMAGVNASPQDVSSHCVAADMSDWSCVGLKTGSTGTLPSASFVPKSATFALQLQAHL